MRFLNTTDINNWAATVDCEHHLPHLIRKLIVATIDNKFIKYIHFPYGEDVRSGGYDGELSCETQNTYVPEGESVWEFGSSNNKGAKADEDYNKRKLDPLDKIPEQTTYINISAKKYRDKRKWVVEKNGEDVWKDVRYYDAIDIDHWLELAPSVELWLAEKLGKPSFGIYSIEEYWKRWSDNKTYKISTQLIAGQSRSPEIEKVKNFIRNETGVCYIKSVTKDESLIFPLAILEQLDEEEKISLSSKMVIVDNRDAFNRLIDATIPIIIIVNFRAENTDITAALHKGHKLIYPLSFSNDITSEAIVLPIVSNDDFEGGLLKMGIDSEQARILNKNTGRNISVLRRFLEIENTPPKWLETLPVSEVIPLLLLNRFSENSAGDREILSKISGKTFDEYEKTLKSLLFKEDAPVYHFNGTWRLVSPTDIWLFMAKHVSKADLDNFASICDEVLQEIAFKYTLPPSERGNFIQTPEKAPKYTSGLKEGLCETLGIIAILGSKYGIGIANPQLYTDNIVSSILTKDLAVWRSLSTNLMTLAEASPSVFLDNLERVIKDQSVKDFYEEENGFLSTSNDIAPLLWCLDTIAWMPEYLKRVSVCLCDLIILAPEKLPTANTPLSSLKSIFRIWYPQTNANAEERKAILEILLKKYPDLIYGLMIGMVNSRLDTAFHIPRPKWRLFGDIHQIRVSNKEVHFMRRFCIDKVIELSRENIPRLLKLIDLLDDMDWDKIPEALGVIESALGFDDEVKNSFFQKFRQDIGNHRSYPDAEWALPNEILQKIELTTNKFKVDDLVLNGKYLFEEHNPVSIDGEPEKDYEKREQENREKRIAFVTDVIEQYSIDRILELGTQVEHPELYGNTLASMELSDENRIKVYRLVDSDNPKHIRLVNPFIRISENRTSLGDQIRILSDLMTSGLSDEGIVRFLLSLHNTIDLWKNIEGLSSKIDTLYWRSQQQYLYLNDKDELGFALSKLNHYKKPFVYLNTLGMNIRLIRKIDFTSEEILKLLEDVSFEDFDDNASFDHHSFESILNLLYTKEDYDEVRGANVEMKFFFVFRGSHSPQPKNLFKLMSKEPDEYMGVLCQVYLPTDEKLREEELEKNKKEDNSKLIFEFTYPLFESFNVIPSLKDDGSLDEKELNDWVSKVRELAKEKFRIESADRSIGKLLAKYPINISENKGYPDEIYELLEEINSEEMKQGFEMQISNNLGFTSRGAFDGGDIERHRAKYFNGLFEKTKITYSNVSLIFKNLRDGYLHDASWEDENALLRSLR